MPTSNGTTARRQTTGGSGRGRGYGNVSSSGYGQGGGRGLTKSLTDPNLRKPSTSPSTSPRPTSPREPTPATSPGRRSSASSPRSGSLSPRGSINKPQQTLEQLEAARAESISKIRAIMMAEQDAGPHDADGDNKFERKMVRMVMDYKDLWNRPGARSQPLALLQTNIAQLYEDKLKADRVDDFKNNERDGMPEYLIEWLQHKYGLGNIVDKQLNNWLGSMEIHKVNHLRTALYAQLLVLPAHYSDFVLEALAQLYPMEVVRENLEKGAAEGTMVTVGLGAAEAALLTMFGDENVQDGAEANPLGLPMSADERARLQRTVREIAQGPGKNKYVDVDVLMTWIHLEHLGWVMRRLYMGPGDFIHVLKGWMLFHWGERPRPQALLYARVGREPLCEMPYDEDPKDAPPPPPPPKVERSRIWVRGGGSWEKLDDEELKTAQARLAEKLRYEEYERKLRDLEIKNKQLMESHGGNAAEMEALTNKVSDLTTERDAQTKKIAELQEALEETLQALEQAGARHARDMSAKEAQLADLQTKMEMANAQHAQEVNTLQTQLDTMIREAEEEKARRAAFPSRGTQTIGGEVGEGMMVDPEFVARHTCGFPTIVKPAVVQVRRRSEPPQSDARANAIPTKVKIMLEENHDSIMAMFKDLDADGDGKLTIQDWQEGMGKLGYEVTLQEIENMYKAFDMDGSGAIEFQELGEIVHCVEAANKVRKGHDAKAELDEVHRNSMGAVRKASLAFGK